MKQFTTPDHTPRRPSAAGVTVLALVLAACGGADTGDEAASAGEMEATAPQVATELTIDSVGFATPESVLHDVANDVYLVSNINGAPLDADDNGFISRISPEGEVLDLTWIDGADENVQLSAPKGMAISDGTLYVTDIDCLRAFDLATGAPTGEYCVEGASFLNDVAADDDGNVYFTDTGLDASFAATGTDAVYMLSGGEVMTVTATTELGAPNGIAVVDGGLRVVTFGSGESYLITPTGERTAVTPIAGSLDGIEPLDDGSFLVSSWETSAVHQVAPDGTVIAVVEGVESPADIGFDATRNRILIPLFNGNAVLFRILG